MCDSNDDCQAGQQCDTSLTPRACAALPQRPFDWATMGGTVGSVVGSAVMLILFYRATQRARKRQGSEGRRWLIATVVLGVAWLVASAASLVLVPIWLTRSLSAGREKDCAKEGAPDCPHPWQVAICNASTDFAYKCFDKATPCANPRLRPDTACGGEQCVPICGEGEVIDCHSHSCVARTSCPDPPAFSSADGAPAGGEPARLYNAALDACVPYAQAGDRDAVQKKLDEACRATACDQCSTPGAKFQGFDWARGRCYSNDIKCATKASDDDWRARYTFRAGDVATCDTIAKKHGEQWCENPTYAQVVAACERNKTDGCRWGWKATGADGSKRCRVATAEACARLDGATWDGAKGECRDKNGALFEEDAAAGGCRPAGENWLMVGRACTKGLGGARASLSAALLAPPDPAQPAVRVTPEYVAFTLAVTLSEAVQNPDDPAARSARGLYYVLYRNGGEPAFGVPVNLPLDFINDQQPTLVQVLHSRSLASERPFEARDAWDVTLLRYDAASNVLTDVLVGSDVGKDKLARLALPATAASFAPDADDAVLLPRPRRDLAEAVVQKLAKDFWDHASKQRGGDAGGQTAVPYHVPPVHSADEYAVVPCVGGGGLCTSAQTGANMLVVLAWALGGPLAGGVRFSVHRRRVSAGANEAPVAVVDFDTPDDWGVPQEGKNALRVVDPASKAEALVYSLTDALVPGESYVYYVAAFDRAFKSRADAPPGKRSPELVLQVVPNAYSDALCLSIPDAAAPEAPFHLLDPASGACMRAVDLPGARDWYCLRGAPPEGPFRRGAPTTRIGTDNLSLFKPSAGACHKVQPSTWLVDASDGGAPLSAAKLLGETRAEDCFSGKLVKRRLLCGVAYPKNRPGAVATDLAQPEFLWHNDVQATGTDDKIKADDVVARLDAVKKLADEHPELARLVQLPQDRNVGADEFVKQQLLECPRRDGRLAPRDSDAPPTAPNMIQNMKAVSGCDKNGCADQPWTPFNFPKGANYEDTVAGYESDIRWLPPDDLAALNGTCCSNKGHLKRNASGALAACECNAGVSGPNCEVETKYKPVMANYWQRFARFPRENEGRVSGVGVMLTNAPTPQYRCVVDPSGAYSDKQACEIDAYKVGDPKATGKDGQPLVTATNTVPNNTGRTDGACKAWRSGPNCDQENTNPCSDCSDHERRRAFSTSCSSKECFPSRFGPNCRYEHEGCDAPFKKFEYPAGEGDNDGWDCQCAVPGEGFPDYDTLEKPPELAKDYVPPGITDLSFRDGQCYRAMNNGDMKDTAIFQFKVDADARDTGTGAGKPGKFYWLNLDRANQLCGRHWTNRTALPRVDIAEIQKLHKDSVV